VHATQPKCLYRYHRQVDDLVVACDNWATMHTTIPRDQYRTAVVE
jgi:alpha-ketoglutarate-dependent taurine dioxygenase